MWFCLVKLSHWNLLFYALFLCCSATVFSPPSHLGSGISHFWCIVFMLYLTSNCWTYHRLVMYFLSATGLFHQLGCESQIVLAQQICADKDPNTPEAEWKYRVMWLSLLYFAWLALSSVRASSASHSITEVFLFCACLSLSPSLLSSFFLWNIQILICEVNYQYFHVNPVCWMTCLLQPT